MFDLCDDVEKAPCQKGAGASIHEDSISSSSSPGEQRSTDFSNEPFSKLSTITTKTSSNVTICTELLSQSWDEEMYETCDQVEKYDHLNLSGL